MSRYWQEISGDDDEKVGSRLRDMGYFFFQKQKSKLGTAVVTGVNKVGRLSRNQAGR